MTVQSNTETASTPSSQDGVSAAVKMDPALKAKWVEALRSGEYKQARGALHTSDGGFCCLGVLCKLTGLETSCNGEHCVTDGRAAGYKPLQAMIGTDDMGQFFKRNDGHYGIRKHTLPEIADYIEQNL